MLVDRVLAHIGVFGIWSAIGLCLGLALLLAYHYKVRQIRVRGKKLLAVELRLEAAWQNARVVTRVFGRRPLTGVFVRGLNNDITGKVLSMEPLDGPPVSRQESIQQSRLSCDI
jgi:hypothetical protein